MATANGRVVRTTIVKQDKVGEAMTFLKELPDKPKEDMSLREAVGHLRDEIKDALGKGYSYADLAKMLTDQGIKISALTLKNYVPSGKRSGSKTKPRRTRKAQSEAAASPSETKLESAPSDAKKPPRRTKAESADAVSTSTDSAAESTPKRSTRGRAKSTTAAKAKTGSRTRAKQGASTAGATAPTRSRRRKTSS